MEEGAITPEQYATMKAKLAAEPPASPEALAAVELPALLAYFRDEHADVPGAGTGAGAEAGMEPGAGRGEEPPWSAASRAKEVPAARPAPPPWAKEPKQAGPATRNSTPGGYQPGASATALPNRVPWGGLFLLIGVAGLVMALAFLLVRSFFGAEPNADDKAPAAVVGSDAGALKQKRGAASHEATGKAGKPGMNRAVGGGGEQKPREVEAMTPVDVKPPTPAPGAAVPDRVAPVTVEAPAITKATATKATMPTGATASGKSPGVGEGGRPESARSAVAKPGATARATGLVGKALPARRAPAAHATGARAGSKKRSLRAGASGAKPVGEPAAPARAFEPPVPVPAEPAAEPGDKEITKRVRRVLADYYADLQEAPFDAARYFAPAVSWYYGHQNVTPEEIEGVLGSTHFPEFKAADTRVEPGSLQVNGPARDGSWTISYVEQSRVYRASQQRYQRSRTRVRLQMNRDLRITRLRSDGLLESIFE